jgi:TetR/AcrR family transcriptional regulator, mexJK operon transcriptional repressor
MSAISSRPDKAPRADDPRVRRSRAAVLDAARTLFLRHGYAGTTMDEIAALAGLTKRTVYNNFGDKDALFREIAADTIATAEAFVRDMRDAFAGVGAAELPAALDSFGRRLALGVVRPEVVAIRRLLIGEARDFPELAALYFDRAPGQVMATLAGRFGYLAKAGLLRVEDPRRAAAQFGYLVAGAALDRAVLTGAVPPEDEIIAGAREGVRTFLSRYAPVRRIDHRGSLTRKRARRTP